VPRRPAHASITLDQSPDARVAARRQVSAAVVAGLFDLWHETLRRIFAKSKLADAIRYAISRRTIFECFLTDGRIELDSNTLLQTAKMNNANPFAWLTLIIQRIANGWPSSQFDALMLWNHAA
jgi:transposase